MTLSVPDDDEDNLCTLIVSLMQKGRRALRHEGVGMLSIGNIVFSVLARCVSIQPQIFKNKINVQKCIIGIYFS